MSPPHHEKDQPAADPGMGTAVIQALQAVIAARRDVRTGFLPQDVPDEELMAMVKAAHAAPSVGFMQPWRFIIVRSAETRAALVRSFKAANQRALDSYEGDRADSYAALKLSALESAPVILGVATEIDAPEGHRLGRREWQETAQYSTAAAIQNLWLTGRAMGIGVGWVSILSKDDVREALTLPDGVEPTAVLCIGYVNQFQARPELETLGWEQRLADEAVVHWESYGSAAPPERGTAQCESAEPKGTK